MSKTRIQELNAALADVRNMAFGKAARIQAELQVEWNKVFDDSQELRKAIENAEQASEYMLDENGEIDSWYRYGGLEDYIDCEEYFETWLANQACMRVDWENLCLTCSQGEALVIQDDSRHARDNGVWLNHKCIIPESAYREDGEDADEVKRNALIEAYMERTGFYPGVFRVDQHGNVFHVNTQPK